MVNYAKRMEAMAYTANVVSNLFGAMTNPDIISFGGGAPAKEALPIDILRQLTDEVILKDKRGVEALQYGPIGGIKDMKEIIVDELLAPKGLKCTVDNVMVVAGGLEGINLICQVYIDPGDVILVESPTFVHSVEIFDMFEAKCIGVDMDEDGLKMDDLELKIRKYHPKMIYTIPTFQNPSGRTLSLERRKKLASLAAEYDVLVLEDDPYRDIRYSGEDLPPIKCFDTAGNVVVANSFSKIFSPGVRLGYVMAEPETIHYLTEAKSATNSHSSMLPQVLCAEFFKRGYYPAHHKMLCDLYRQRRDAMLSSIDEFFPEGTKHSFPDGGLFTWVELPGDIDTAQLLKEATSDPDVMVAFVAGEGFFVGRTGEGRNCMRMSFGNNPPERIREGVMKLGKLIDKKLAQQGR
jgi:2-aminoadipate transaminase